MTGGAGNDSYIVDNASDIVTELLDEGHDTIRTSVTYTAAINVEALELTGTGAINGTGNALNNTLTGNSAANVLNGSAGADTMSGGAGNDTYVVDDAGDVILEIVAEGTDVVQATVSYTIGANVETLTLTGTAATSGTGNAANNTLNGNSAANVLDGGAGADTMVGGTGNDTYVVDNVGDVITEAAGAGTDIVQSSITYTLGTNLENLTLSGSAAIDGTGNSASNVITGNSAANVLTGGTGADTLIGGDGDDTYFVDNAGDVVDEGVGQGTDSVQASATYTLAANVENLTLSGTAAINGTGNSSNNSLTGNSAANVLNGGAGVDTLVGGMGDDTYVVDEATDVVIEAASAGTDTVQSSATYALQNNVEKLTLTGTAAINAIGNALANTLTGNATSNVLDGGAGADSMSGGAGDDTYVVDNTGDVVTEAASAGTDTVRSGLTYTLGANVENLALTGATAIDGTGNTANNVLTGNAGANSLTGLAGDDTLDGAAGNDSLVGGTGNDTYLFGRGDGQDVVVENDTTVNNMDKIVFKAGVAVADVSAVREGDALILRINGTVDQVRVNGYFANNGANAAMVEEVRFADSPTVWNYAYLAAMVGNNAPVLASALADQSANAATPFDWTVPAGSFTDGDPGAVLTYSATLENLTALPSWLTFDPATQRFAGTPTGADAGTLQVRVVAHDQFGASTSDVFALTVVAAEPGIRGTAGADTLAGTVGDDLILGFAGNDVLSGGGGNDTLDGGIGSDAMSGGAGDDVYLVDNTSDTVTENASEGTDAVQSSMTFTLGANIENLTLTGTAAIDATGNSLANTLTGNDAANALNGGTGADTMLGGLGDDIYIVDNASDSVIEGADGGVDLIRSSVARTLGANVENLTLTGNTAINGTGNGLANVLTGNTSANTLTGGAGNDTLIGGKGWDVLVGGDGHDVYLLARGDSTDAIAETGSSSTNQDTARFGADIAADQLWFRQVSNNLEVSVIGTSDKFSITNWYLGTQYRVERFESGNELALTSGQVQNLVNAMASFAPPAAGQTTLPADYAATLNPVIAANWQ
ncbi:hypothetical protein ASF45_31960 [Pseudorhodoferax sp. Leaf265]|nr:hypothetical protein ASF45_31960 [Pseudorhodoferax sp. Leaf265]